MNAIYARLQEIFRAVLLDDSVMLTPETSGKDFEAWDSLMHVTVMVHAERAFAIRFTSSEISDWETAGELAVLIEDRLQKKSAIKQDDVKQGDVTQGDVKQGDVQQGDVAADRGGADP